ncbi:MAG: thiol:disulfide interchange protein DsbA/DsbL [Acidiferrobacterales bacterium]|nr:thiol:disulfide interchange protein DsbA/DsbL [Acidiferrobacterales bacterium]
MNQLLSRTITAFLATLFFLPSVWAQSDRYVEGGHYELLGEFQPVQTGDKIEVVEMFWYRCPHCYRLEPYLEKWLQNKPENAEYVPIPALLNNSWAFQARAFFTFEALGLTDTLHAKFFDAIHKERRPFNTVDQLAEWAQEYGADPEDIRKTMDSFAVNNKLNFAALMSKKYGITGVPAIIVDGKYRTNVSMAGSHEELFNLIDFLIEKAAAERQS